MKKIINLFNSKKAFSLVLAFAMVIAMLPVNSMEVKAAATNWTQVTALISSITLDDDNMSVQDAKDFAASNGIASTTGKVYVFHELRADGKYGCVMYNNGAYIGTGANDLWYINGSILTSFKTYIIGSYQGEAKEAQTITASDITVAENATSGTISATASGRGALSYAIKSGSPTNVIDVNSSTGAFTIIGVGTTTVTITAAENLRYLPATKDISVTVSAFLALDGTAEINPYIISYGDTLTVTHTLTNQVGTLSYQWQRTEPGVGWVDIAGETGTTYTPVASDIYKSFIVKITSSGNSGFIMSSSTFGLAKANGPIPPNVTGVACTTESNNDGKITGTDATMEYSRFFDFSSAFDCSGTEITGLTPGRYYVRFKETATHLEGRTALVLVLGYTPDAPVTYTVSFNANGGTGTQSDATGISGSYTLPTTTTFTAPSGKVFDGWSESAGGTKIATSTISIAADKTLYAVWKTPITPPAPPAPQQPSAPSEPAKVEAPKTEVVTVNYSVVKGDTLSKIAKRNGLTLAEIIALNPQIKDPNKIKVGQVIIVKTTKQDPSNDSINSSAATTGEYLVEKGDTLSKIAKRNKISLKALIAKNPQIKDINVIHIGEKINL